MLRGGDGNTGHHYYCRHQCSNPQCDYVLRCIQGLGSSLHTWQWQHWVSPPSQHYVAPPPSVAQLVAAIDQMQQTMPAGLPSQLYTRLCHKYAGHDVSQLCSLSTFCNFLISQNYNHRHQIDPAIARNPINFGASLVEFAQMCSIFCHLARINCHPVSNYWSVEDLATALGCNTIYDVRQAHHPCHCRLA